jgi:predicted PurR-regulated permease PerM
MADQNCFSAHVRRGNILCHSLWFCANFSALRSRIPTRCDSGHRYYSIVHNRILRFVVRFADIGRVRRSHRKLPEQISDLRETIRELPLGQRFLGTVEQGNTGTDNNGGTERIVFQFGMTVADAVSSLVIVFAIGIYFTINPEMYKKGVALLFTKNYAERVYDAVETAGNALWRWLTGQLIAMLFVGVSVTIGLLLLDVPLALVIGVLSGLADFVPIIGPIAAFVPAFFLALSVDTETAIYTSLLYLAVQQIEGNVVTPLVQKKMVYVPPAVILLSMVAFGAVFGIPGVILATPLTVIAMVFIGMFYVQDVLGKDVTIPGKN